MSGSTFAERIAWIVERYEDGSCRAMGRRLGVSGQAISAWTRGETKPSSESLAAIARTYPELRTEWLLLGEGPPRSRPRPPERGSGGEGSGGEPRRSGQDSGPAGPDEPASADARYVAGWSDAVARLRDLLARLEPEP